ncbi:hypothetical protein [uncultured Brevundimonas sp.]|uniref:hypothetical protein n=1 Tax=uncultured Brevundimonas sp. TaxID=213418 RepID=UPI0026090A42|nr:hypothetical protein [uncultured Brevundimonas sp.]
MSSSSKRALDQVEQLLVDQTKSLESFTHRELTELAHQLRSRRERVQRMIRQRARDARRSGKANPDTGAHEKKSLLVEAIDRVNSVLAERAATRTGPSEASKPASKPKAPAKATAKAEAKPAEKPAAKSEAKPKAPAKAAAKSADKKPAEKAEKKPATAKKPAAKKS